MKTFLVAFALSVFCGYCYSNNQHYWRCSKCGEFRKSSQIPEPKMCIATNFQNFHNWLPVELCLFQYFD